MNPVEAADGTSIRVYESSTMDGPHIWAQIALPDKPLLNDKPTILLDWPTADRFHSHLAVVLAGGAVASGPPLAGSLGGTIALTGEGDGSVAIEIVEPRQPMAPDGPDADCCRATVRLRADGARRFAAQLDWLLAHHYQAPAQTPPSPAEAAPSTGERARQAIAGALAEGDAGGTGDEAYWLDRAGACIRPLSEAGLLADQRIVEALRRMVAHNRTGHRRRPVAEADKALIEAANRSEPTQRPRSLDCWDCDEAANLPWGGPGDGTCGEHAHQAFEAWLAAKELLASIGGAAQPSL